MPRVALNPARTGRERRNIVCLCVCAIFLLLGVSVWACFFSHQTKKVIPLPPPFFLVQQHAHAFFLATKYYTLSLPRPPRTPVNCTASPARAPPSLLCTPSCSSTTPATVVIRPTSPATPAAGEVGVPPYRAAAAVSVRKVNST